MPVTRFSIRFADSAEDCHQHVEQLRQLAGAFTRAIKRREAAAAARGLRDLTRAIDETAASVDGLIRRSSVFDDAFRAIGAIAQAGPDTEAVQRVLREMVDQQTRRAPAEEGDAIHAA